MKFLKNLFGQSSPPETTWNIKPPGERPAPRARSAVEDEPKLKQKKPESNPFLDNDDLAILEETISHDDPYQSHTWQMDPDSDTRRMKAIQIGKNTDKPSDAKFNPYDTGTSRRGWKK